MGGARRPGRLQRFVCGPRLTVAGLDPWLQRPEVVGCPHRIKFDANSQADAVHRDPQRGLVGGDLPIRRFNRRQPHYRFDREFGRLVLAQEAGVFALQRGQDSWVRHLGRTSSFSKREMIRRG